MVTGYFYAEENRMNRLSRLIDKLNIPVYIIFAEMVQYIVLIIVSILNQSINGVSMDSSVFLYGLSFEQEISWSDKGTSSGQDKKSI